MADLRKKTCMVCGLTDGHTLIDCPFKCDFCGESVKECGCLDSSLVRGVVASEADEVPVSSHDDTEGEDQPLATSVAKSSKANVSVEDCSGKKKRKSGKAGGRKTMPAKQKLKDLKEQLESVLKQKERSEELSQKREEEHLRTIAAMQNRIEKLEGKLANQQTESRKNAFKVLVPHDADDTSDEEHDEETESPKPKKARGTITGMNLERIHERYDGVLEIFKKKNCSLAQAMREFDVPRNTIRDYIGMCELKIIDIEKYHSVVQQERGVKGKAPIKNIELCRREALSGYRAQSNKLKEEGKLLPFYPNENFFAVK